MFRGMNTTSIVSDWRTTVVNEWPFQHSRWSRHRGIVEKERKRIMRKKKKKESKKENQIHVYIEWQKVQRVFIQALNSLIPNGDIREPIYSFFYVNGKTIHRSLSQSYWINFDFGNKVRRTFPTFCITKNSLMSILEKKKTIYRFEKFDFRNIIIELTSNNTV